MKYARRQWEAIAIILFHIYGISMFCVCVCVCVCIRESASRSSGARSLRKLELRFNIPSTMDQAQNAEHNNEKKNNNNEDYNNTPDAEQKSRRLKH